MLKRASKEYKKNVKNLPPAVLRQLEARQLALKYVANVTYGYTSATFSGRCAMPLLADTIVECGRKTLRKAINMANSWGREGKWKGARVIYGDTDSLFVRLPGRTYKEAFDFGEELCKAVTADNPPPVQLKLEKVYLGSIMQTMKRYCGMKFESRTERKPAFEAKGLETVRRDQCALTQKVLQNTLITLFRQGIDAVHEYLNRQWYLINAGHIPISEFILTGRVRSQYRGGREGPVQAVLAQRLAEADPGNVVRHKERIPYVIVATPGKKFKLKDCVLTPLEMLERWDGYTIHSAYYIERVSTRSLYCDN
jgi:DNA polymerase zeta